MVSRRGRAGEQQERHPGGHVAQLVGGVTGTSRDWFSAGKWQIASGRVFNEAEERAGAAVCVIGETVRRNCSAGWIRSAADPGQTVLL
jgi:hypothetical protein